MLNLLILLQAAVPNAQPEQEQASFTFWLITELVGAVFVFALLYFFFIKNPKINPPRQKRDEDTKA